MSIGDDFGAVISAARSGESRAFEKLYADLSPDVRLYLRSQGVDEPDDTTSEVFLGVFAGLESFDGTEVQFRRWVFNIAHRRVADEQRRRSRRRRIAATAIIFDDHIGNAEDDALNVLGSQRVIELCRELPSEQRDVLLLRIMADLTVSEIADVIGRSVAAVKGLQRRGAGRLRRRMDKEESAHE